MKADEGGYRRAGIPLGTHEEMLFAQEYNTCEARASVERLAVLGARSCSIDLEGKDNRPDHMADRVFLLTSRARLCD